MTQLLISNKKGNVHLHLIMYFKEPYGIKDQWKCLRKMKSDFLIIPFEAQMQSLLKFSAVVT